MAEEIDLKCLGWDAFFAGHFAVHAQKGLAPSRVVVAHRGAYELVGRSGELRGELPGKLQKQWAGSERPVVGDWVAVRIMPCEAKGIIQALLPRRTKFSRKTAGLEVKEQVVAANIDVVFILASLEAPLNSRRLERFVASSWESGAQPVLLLTKADLCEDTEEASRCIALLGPNVPAHFVSAVRGQGLEALAQYFTGHRTAACLGPSGVGKSTLINALVGEALLEVQEVRERDAKGRHTTTRRELVPLPGGGLIMDTPGLRELHLWDLDSGLGSTFPEIEALANQCRFRDCQHIGEPACAVRTAVANGQIEPKRLEAYHKLHRELKTLATRQHQRAASERKRQGRLANKDHTSLPKPRPQPSEE